MGVRPRELIGGSVSLLFFVDIPRRLVLATSMKRNQILAEQQHYFNKFQEGNEKGLEFFYKRLYPSLYHRGLRYIKDDVNADCIVNEAFLRLWLIRKSINNPEHIETFVKKLTADACKAYFRTSSNRFQRNMLRLDEIENYQDFICGYDSESVDDSDVIYQQELDEKVKSQWSQVDAIIPSLTEEQQLFIRLCLKYSFNYDRIAWHIGGISDYQVAIKVEKTLACLKAILTNAQKLNDVGRTSRFKFEGDLCAEQSAILNMRYELKYSFEEIAKALNLNQGHIQKVFANACTKIKKVKS